MMSSNAKSLRKDLWRWWCGGGVIGVAAVIGCASAVDFKKLETSHVHGPVLQKRGVAAVPGEEEPHNGGKMRLPVSASFDSKPSVVVTSPKEIFVSITSEADVKNVSGVIEGIDGLEGVQTPLTFTEIEAGQTIRVPVSVPARSGHLAVRLAGSVGEAGPVMGINIDLEVKSNDIRAHAKPGASDMDQGVGIDATGQAIRSMRAK